MKTYTNNAHAYYRITCFVPALKFACDVPQLREKISAEQMPEGVTFDPDGVSSAECVAVSGGEMSVWYEEAP